MAAAAAPHAHQAAMGTSWVPSRGNAEADYNDAYRARPQDDAVVVAARLARAAYMRAYRARPRTEEEVTAERARKAGYMKKYRVACSGQATVA